MLSKKQHSKHLEYNTETSNKHKIHIHFLKSKPGLLSENLLACYAARGNLRDCSNLLRPHAQWHKALYSHREEHKLCKSGSDLLPQRSSSHPTPPASQLCIQGEGARKAFLRKQSTRSSGSPLDYHCYEAERSCPADCRQEVPIEGQYYTCFSWRQHRHIGAEKKSIIDLHKLPQSPPHESDVKTET